MFDERLEIALADLGRGLAFPQTPDLAVAVGREIRNQAGTARRALPWRPFRRSLALAGLSLVVLGGAVGAVGLGTGAIHIGFGSPPISVTVADQRGFGTEMGLEQAQQQAGFAIRLPDGDLDPADHILFTNVPRGGTVTLVWDDLPGFPTGSDGIGLAVMEFSADIGPENFTKIISEGSFVVTTRVGPRLAWWVEGGEHWFFYTDAAGDPVAGTIRLVGNVLFWEDDGLTLRIEGAPTLEAAQDVAEQFLAD